MMLAVRSRALCEKVPTRPSRKFAQFCSKLKVQFGMFEVLQAFGLPLALIANVAALMPRSEEHTSELQSLTNLVCRLLLEKKNPILCECTALGSDGWPAA